MPTVIQVKRGTASSWTSADTVLAAGEIGFESDTKKMKVGDGSTAWTSLLYVGAEGDITAVVAGTGLSGGSTSGSATLSLSTPVATTNGGTGLSTFTTGDLVYASGADTLAKRSIGTTGQVLTVSGGVPAWATPASPTFVGAAAYNANFTLAGTGDQLISLPNEEFDSNGFHDNSTNNSRLTVPAGYAGKYLVTAHIDMNGISGYYINSIRQYNSAGSQLTINATGRSFSGTGGGNNFGGGALTYIVSAAVGDYFQLFYSWQGSTTFVSQNARLQIQYLGA